MDELDLAAKALLREFPATFARLALGRDAPIRSAAAVNVELPALARRVDTVLRVRLADERRPVLAHVEIAASWKADVPRRVYEYRTLLRRSGEVVESVVLCLKPGVKQGRPDGRHDELGRTNALRFTFPVMCLWQLRERDLRRFGEALLPLVPYARDATPLVVERAMDELASVRPVVRRADLQAALATFAGNVFDGIDWMGRIPREVLVRNTFIEAVRLDGAREVLGRLLRRRLGTAARPYVKRLDGASSRTLRRIERLVIDSPSKDDLTAALDRLLPPTREPARRGRPAV